MTKYLFILLLACTCPGLAFEKLSDDYCVYYGNINSEITITQYYAFTCPHCVSLFRREFPKVKEEYLDSQKICWIYHPVPMDQMTVQAMECLRRLDNREKQIFLEAILEEMVMVDQPLTAKFMKKGMEILGKPIPDLMDKTYLSNCTAFEDAFHFLTQDHVLEAVPSTEVNGRFYPSQVPDLRFIETVLKNMRK